MGLREKKKQENKQQIVKCAKEIFLSQGYERATMEQIAQKANVGTGTIYNYFKSKAQLFVAVIMEERIDMPIGDTISEQYLAQNHPLVVFDKIIEASMQNVKNISKELWIEIFKAVLSNLDDKEYLKSTFLGLDQQFMASIKKIFHFFKNKGYMNDSFSEHQAVQCFFDILVSEIMVYMLQDSITIEDCTANIQRLIRFVFENKLKEVSQ